MTGIGDLQAMFTATQKTEASTGTNGRGTRAAATDAAAGTVDKSVITTAGGGLLAALSESDVRMDKVQALQTQIAQGTYSVSASDVAQSLMKSMLAGPLGGRR